MLDNFSWQWSWHPGTTLLLLVFCFCYFLGIRQARARARKRVVGPAIKLRHILAFCVSLILMATVLLTPIDTVARTQYFWVHIAQTVILITVCAPLLVVSCGWVVALVLERPAIRAILAFLTGPVVASVLFNIVFLLWHAPKILDAAVSNPVAYQIMEWSIFACSLLNWYPLIGESRQLRTMSYPMQMLYAFVDGQPVDIFAFVLVYTDVSIYPRFQASVGAHLPTYGDQALGGALLLIPGLVDLVVMTPLFFAWLRMIEQRTMLADQKRQRELEEEEEVEESPVS
jgi:cytochrome c oxidase assembly factor CtaG